MIDFSTLKGLTVPEGVVVKIEDINGAVLWEAEDNGTVILEVEKITNDTYAGETTYENESFILLDIYPKSSGTVNVTYGGLTKTIVDTSGTEEPNAQQVFFGTFNGVSDDVETSASGTLTIEGDYRTFGVGAYITDEKGLNSYCSCIKAIVIIDSITSIPSYGFYNCSSMTNDLAIFSTVTSIGERAFYGCSGLTGNLVIPEGVTSINGYTFANCSGLTGSLIIPEGVTTIGAQAFYRCSGLTGNLVIPEGVTSIGEGAFYECNDLGDTLIIPSTVTDIGKQVFFGCKKLTKFIILATTPPTLSGVFSTTNYFESITVPAGCGEAYKTAEYWSSYEDIIVEAS